MGTSGRRIRLLNGIPIDDEGNPLSEEEQRAYFAEHPQPRSVESGSESNTGGWSDAPSPSWQQAEANQGGWSPAPQPSRGGFEESGEEPVSHDAARANGKAIASIVCGILAILFSASVIPGLVFGIAAIALSASAARGTRSGKAIAGRVCGIIGVVLATLTLLSAIALGAFSLSFLEETFPDDSMVYEADGYGSYDAQDQEIFDLAKARLDEFCAMNDDQLAALGERLNEEFREMNGSYSYSDLGVDPTEVARWASSSMSYEIESSYAFPEEGYGSVYATVTCRDYYEMLSTFADRADEFLASDEAASLAEEEGVARLGQIVRDCMAASTGVSENFINIEFVRNGNAWTIDEDGWQEEVDYIFWLF